uniref:Uncharacterized protein n=1 Tax=Mycena chlorophos TaxID=658473 RepID=A0ABQ0LQ48_MYCCL|nr:predicted protein [Mycena chlorophos]
MLSKNHHLHLQATAVVMRLLYDTSMADWLTGNQEDEILASILRGHWPDLNFHSSASGSDLCTLSLFLSSNS